MILRGRKDMKINDSFIAEAKNLGLEIDIEKNDCAIRFPLKSRLMEKTQKEIRMENIEFRHRFWLVQ